MFKRGWNKFNEWIRHFPLPAYIVLVVAVAFALLQLQDTVDRQQGERNARIQAAAELQRYICIENNRQDKTLADLVSIYLEIRKTKLLTVEQKRTRELVEDALGRLEYQTPCNLLVRIFREASGENDFQRLREILLSRDPAVASKR